MPETIEVGIDGVLLFQLTSHPDDRGSFTEDYRREWIPGGREMVQGNISKSRANVLRGLHFHRQQADWWNFYAGAAVVGLYDLRTGSPTEGIGLALRLATSEGLRGLYIPRGIAHGFYAETDVLLHYMVDNYYTGDDEFGVTWDDAGLGIAWPSPDPILSERDRSNPTLTAVLAEAPAYQG
jgi:dTDP-4-dehydrorhamnose 3,5-epimerase